MCRMHTSMRPAREVSRPMCARERTASGRRACKGQRILTAKCGASRPETYAFVRLPSVDHQRDVSNVQDGIDSEEGTKGQNSVWDEEDAVPRGVNLDQEGASRHQSLCDNSTCSESKYGQCYHDGEHLSGKCLRSCTNGAKLWTREREHLSTW